MIRRMKKADIEQIISDETRIFGNSLGETHLNEGLDNELESYFCYEIDGKIVAYIGLWHDQPNGQILNFYVLEEYRGKGIAKKLLEYSLEYLDSKNIEVITLEVRYSNYAAQDLYEKYDFNYEYKRKYYYSDGEDALVYVRRKD